jgi:hypothetical protein
MRGRLWVLDAGTPTCWPKVVVLDLRRNEEVRQIKLCPSQERKNMRENEELRGVCGGSNRRMEKKFIMRDLTLCTDI